MPEPSPEVPLVRAVNADGFSNPILYIEELRRLPLNRSRAPAPGTAVVFRHRSGETRTAFLEVQRGEPRDVTAAIGGPIFVTCVGIDCR